MIMIMAVAVCMTLALPGCKKAEQNVSGENPALLRISPTLTRATDTSFEEGDRIGVTVSKSGETYAENVMMEFSQSVFSGDLEWYEDTETTSEIYAYYPYSESGVPATFTVAADQSKGTSPSDFIIGSIKDAKPSGNAIAMTFRHVLSKIVVDITNDTDADIASITLKGSVITADVDVTETSVSASASSEIADITTYEAAANERYYAILVPQTVSLVLEVSTSDSKTYSRNLEEVTLGQGGERTVTARISEEQGLQVKVAGDDEDWTDEDETEPGDEDDGIVKILAIGNSFSQDAVEQYLWELFDAAGIEAVIGNLYIGGCTLDTHYSNMQSGEGAYAYRKVVDGEKTETAGFSLLNGITDENWDYISLQQASGSSGQYSTYTHLPELIQYVRDNALNQDMQVAFHQTWAYASTSNHAEFPKYDNDQMTMYNAIMDAVQQAVADNDIDLVIPSGTAIQNGRNSFIGDAFNRDGYHLETTYGRYTAACTWFESISGIPATQNTWQPETVDDTYGKIARNAAHFAVLNPYEVNPMTDFQAPEVTSDGQTPIYIDFGSSRATSWNNVAVYELSESDRDIFLKDEDGNYTSVVIPSLDGFTDMYNGVGSEPDEQDLVAGGITWLRDAWVDGIVVSGTKGEGNVGPAHITFSGLDPAVTYDFNILAVRYNGSADARITRFSVEGITESGIIEIKQGMKSWTGENLDNYLAAFHDVIPSADGKVILSVEGLDTGAAADGNINAVVISPK